MESLLKEHFGKDTTGWSQDHIKLEFDKKISKQTRELLEDIQSFGY